MTHSFPSKHWADWCTSRVSWRHTCCTASLRLLYIHELQHVSIMSKKKLSVPRARRAMVWSITNALSLAMLLQLHQIGDVVLGQSMVEQSHRWMTVEALLTFLPTMLMLLFHVARVDSAHGNSSRSLHHPLENMKIYLKGVSLAVGVVVPCEYYLPGNLWRRQSTELAAVMLEAFSCILLSNYGSTRQLQCSVHKEKRKINISPLIISGTSKAAYKLARRTALPCAIKRDVKRKQMRCTEAS